MPMKVDIYGIDFFFTFVLMVQKRGQYFTITILGYELLRVLLPPGGILQTMFFHKAYHLTKFLKHVSPLAAGVFGSYSVLFTLPVILKKKQNYVIKAVKVVFEQFKLAK